MTDKEKNTKNRKYKITTARHYFAFTKFAIKTKT